MSANKVSCEELQGVVGKRGYFPEDMPIKDYPADFVEGLSDRRMAAGVPDGAG